MTDVAKSSETPGVNVTPEMRLEFAEILIEEELDTLRTLCHEKNVLSMGYQPRLELYIAGLSVKED